MIYHAWLNMGRTLCDYCNGVTERAKLDVDMPVGFSLPEEILTNVSKCQDCGDDLPQDQRL